MRPTLAQFEGCVIGQCLADALGSPVEGRPDAVCQYAEHTLTGDKVTSEARRGNAAFGQYTDDSQLARELLLSY